MFYTRRFQKQLQLHWLALCMRVELFIWRQIIALNRLARTARLWLQPIGLGLWLLPAAFVFGFAVSLFS